MNPQQQRENISLPDERMIADAYAYLLARALVIRQEQMDLKEPGFAYNKIKYNPLGAADFVNPNLDVAYLEAWVAVDAKTPVILEVPEVTDRYYTAQVLDEWAEVIVNINERTFPSKPFGKYALVTPGSTAPIPEGAARIELHSSKAKLLARVELKGDPDGAVALQKQFRLASTGKPQIAAAVPIPDFNNKDLMGAEIFENVDAILASALDVSPVAAVMQQKARFVAASIASGKDTRTKLDKLLRETVVPEFEEFAVTKSSPYLNHWLVTLGLGNFGAAYRLRTAANYVGIWANTSDEVVYFVGTRDSNEKPLNGSNSYVIHFPADKLPDTVVNAYWSVILVSVPDYRVVPNSLNRFNLNSHSPLATEPDGSLKLSIGPKAIDGVPESNWLPSPAGKPFSLTFRTYVPKDIVKRGEWTPPALTLID